MSPSIAQPAASQGARNAGIVLGTLSFCHFINDMLQSLLPALYPLLRETYALSFAQIGAITLTYQITASILQPLVGSYTDKHPLPYSLAAGMAFTACGLILLGTATSYNFILLGAACIGIGSSIFHPESSRLARLASGGRHGFAQSVFQVGGNAGSACGPLMAAFVLVTRGQSGVAWFALIALLGIVLLAWIGHWYARHRQQNAATHKAATMAPVLDRGQIFKVIAVLLVLIFSKYFYLVSLSSYYTLYLIDRFQISVTSAQLHLFVFLAAVAAGTFLGGPIGDRIGRKKVIWASIFGMLPFTLILPHANLFWTTVLTVPIGIVMASAFPAIVVYAQELIPGRVGLISGLFFGFAFGMGGIGAYLLGELADRTSIEFVYLMCSFLPILGLFAAFLPRTNKMLA